MPVGKPEDVARCPRCGSDDLKVSNSRKVLFSGFVTVRRRRDCLACFHRYVSVEVSEGLAQWAELEDLAREMRRED